MTMRVEALPPQPRPLAAPPKERARSKVTKCKYGTRCRAKNCKFSHPAAAETNIREAKDNKATTAHSEVRMAPPGMPPVSSIPTVQELEAQIPQAASPRRRRPVEASRSLSSSSESASLLEYNTTTSLQGQMAPNNGLHNKKGVKKVVPCKYGSKCKKKNCKFWHSLLPTDLNTSVVDASTVEAKKNKDNTTIPNSLPSSSKPSKKEKKAVRTSKASHKASPNTTNHKNKSSASTVATAGGTAPPSVLDASMEEPVQLQYTAQPYAPVSPAPATMNLDAADQDYTVPPALVSHVSEDCVLNVLQDDKEEDYNVDDLFGDTTTTTTHSTLDDCRRLLQQEDERHESRVNHLSQLLQQEEARHSEERSRLERKSRQIHQERQQQQEARLQQQRQETYHKQTLQQQQQEERRKELEARKHQVRLSQIQLEESLRKQEELERYAAQQQQQQEQQKQQALDAKRRRRQEEQACRLAASALEEKHRQQALEEERRVQQQQLQQQQEERRHREQEQRLQQEQEQAKRLQQEQQEQEQRQKEKDEKRRLKKLEKQRRKEEEKQRKLQEQELERVRLEQEHEQLRKEQAERQRLDDEERLRLEEEARQEEERLKKQLRQEEIRRQKEASERKKSEKKNKKAKRHQKYLEELEQQEQERAHFWVGQQTKEDAYSRLMAQLCTAEFVRQKMAKSSEPKASTRKMVQEAAPEELDTLCRAAFHKLFADDIQRRVVVAGFNQDLDGRLGTINYWDSSKEKFCVLLDTKKGKKAQEQFFKPGHLKAHVEPAQKKKKANANDPVLTYIEIKNFYGGLNLDVCPVEKSAIENMAQLDSSLIDEYLTKLMETRDEEERQRKIAEEEFIKAEAEERKRRAEQRRREQEEYEQRQREYQERKREYDEWRKEEKREARRAARDPFGGGGPTHMGGGCNCPKCMFAHLFRESFASAGFGGGGFFFAGSDEDDGYCSDDWDEQWERQEAEEREARNQEFAEILGVDVDASQEVIKREYRRQCLIYHPDKFRPDKHETGMTIFEAEEHFKNIRNAYDHLMSNFDDGDY